MMSIKIKLMTRRFLSTEIPPLTRIGKALLTIPEEYKTFFERGQQERDSFYDENLKLILHLEERGPEDPSQSVKALEIKGRKEIFNIIERMKLLMKWGHFFWRLSDLSALKLDPIRVIRPTLTNGESGLVEMKIYWQLKVKVDGERILFIDGKDRKMNLKSLIQVQLQRFQFQSKTMISTGNFTEKILYTGITRYVFEVRTGYCKEMHVERVEPKVGGIAWKWKMSKGVKFSEAG